MSTEKLWELAIVLFSSRVDQNLVFRVVETEPVASWAFIASAYLPDTLCTRLTCQVLLRLAALGTRLYTPVEICQAVDVEPPVHIRLLTTPKFTLWGLLREEGGGARLILRSGICATWMHQSWSGEGAAPSLFRNQISIKRQVHDVRRQQT